MKAIYLKARKSKSEIGEVLKSTLFNTAAWIGKGKDLAIETRQSAREVLKRVLFLREARNRALPGQLLTGLGWFNKGSGSVLFREESTEKTLFSVFSVLPEVVAGRVRTVKR